MIPNQMMNQMNPTMNIQNIQQYNQLGTHEEPRVKDVIVVKPIIYGNVALWQGKKAEPEKTHKWTAFLKSAKEDDDLSWIKKVVWTLHPSFENPIVEVTKPPFELEQFGWGEFEMKVTIYFTDTAEPPVDVFFFIRLYPDNQNVSFSKKPVVFEYYDEILFYEPHESFYRVLTQHKGIPKRISVQHYIDQYGKILSEHKELQKVKKAIELVDAQIKSLEERYQRAENEANQLKEEIARLEKPQLPPQFTYPGM